MRVWLPIAAVALLVCTWMWTERTRLGVLRHAQSKSSANAGGEVPTAAAPVPANCSAPLSLDDKIILHLVPLPGSRSGCRVELRTQENPFLGDSLQDGDVITVVGRDPMSPQVALGLVHRLELAGQTGVAVTVLRGGETREVVARVAP